VDTRLELFADKSVLLLSASGYTNKGYVLGQAFRDIDAAPYINEMINYLSDLGGD
jgi:hypothetical protein